MKREIRQEVKMVSDKLSDLERWLLNHPDEELQQLCFKASYANDWVRVLYKKLGDIPAHRYE